MKIKAVLFDCDGLMFNTEKISQRMWRQEAEKYNVIPDSFLQRLPVQKEMKISCRHFYQRFRI
jgi:beta-phosphoglucomutase-like phosphatase (HAD superfamily)